MTCCSFSYKENRREPISPLRNDGDGADVSLPSSATATYYAGDPVTTLHHQAAEQARLLCDPRANYTGTIACRCRAPGFWRIFEAIKQRQAAAGRRKYAAALFPETPAIDHKDNGFFRARNHINFCGNGKGPAHAG